MYISSFAALSTQLNKLLERRRKVPSRRAIMQGIVSSLVGASWLAADTKRAWGDSVSFRRYCREIEQLHGGRLGVSILDTTRSIALSYRAHERFPICSTFKILATGLILSRVDHGTESLKRHVSFRRDQLVVNSPQTSRHVAEGMSLESICAAAMSFSDNTAVNLMMESYGGPRALTAFLRSLG
jgi:beta-lactamase class A